MKLNTNFVIIVGWILDVPHVHIHAVIRKIAVAHVIRNHFIEQTKYYLT